MCSTANTTKKMISPLLACSMPSYVQVEIAYDNDGRNIPHLLQQSVPL